MYSRPAILFLVLCAFASVAFASLTWETETRGGIATDPIVLNNRVIVGTDTGNLYAFSMATGQRAWNWSVGDSIQDVILFRNDVVALARNGKMVRVRDDGTLLWAADLKNLGHVKNMTYGMAAGAIQIFVTTDRGIASVDSNGNSTLFYVFNATYSKPTLIEPYLIVGINDQLTLFRLSSSAPQWQRKVGTLWRSRPIVSGNRIIVGTLDNRVYALELADGLEDWRVETGAWVVSPARVEEGTVFIGSNDGYLYAMDIDSGNVHWRAKTGGAVQTQAQPGAIESESVVFAGSQDHRVYAFDQSTGKRIWTWEARDWITALAETDGRILAGTRDGKLYLHTLDRGCTIDSPESGVVVGPRDISLAGFAFPNAPTTQVQVRVNSGPWQTVASGGAWSYLLASNALQDGSNLIACRAVDPVGEQQDAYLMEVQKDGSLPLGRFEVSYPLEASVNEEINITVVDSETLERVDGYTLTVGTDGTEYTGDSSGSVVLQFPEPARVDATIRKQGFDDAHVSIRIIRPGDFSGLVLPGAVVLIGGGAIVFLAIKKLKSMLEKAKKTE